MIILSDLKHYRFALDDNGDFILFDKQLNNSLRVAKMNMYSLQSAVARGQNKRRILEKKQLRERYKK